jgi:hypothetical protein
VIALAGDPARAQTIAHGNWSGGPHSSGGKFAHCAVSARYDSGITATFALHANWSLTVAFTHPEFALTEGSAYDVVLRIDDLPPRRLKARALGSKSLAAFLPPSRAVYDQFRAGRIFRFEGDESTIALPLDGTAGALERLAECVHAHVGGTNRYATATPAAPPPAVAQPPAAAPPPAAELPPGATLLTESPPAAAARPPAGAALTVPPAARIVPPPPGAAPGGAAPGAPAPGAPTSGAPAPSAAPAAPPPAAPPPAAAGPRAPPALSREELPVLSRAAVPALIADLFGRAGLSGITMLNPAEAPPELRHYDAAWKGPGLVGAARYHPPAPGVSAQTIAAGILAGYAGTCVGRSQRGMRPDPAEDAQHFRRVFIECGELLRTTRIHYIVFGSTERGYAVIANFSRESAARLDAVEQALAHAARAALAR